MLRIPPTAAHLALRVRPCGWRSRRPISEKPEVDEMHVANSRLVVAEPILAWQVVTVAKVPSGLDAGRKRKKHREKAAGELALFGVD